MNPSQKTPEKPMFVTVPLDTPEECIAEIRAAGVVPIKTDNPNGVKMIGFEINVPHSDMLMAALKALREPGAGAERTIFICDLHSRMLAREQSCAPNTSAKP